MRCHEKYDEEACKQLWTNANANGELQLGTLHFWAKNDNPDIYETIISNDIIKMMNTMPDTHVGIANMMKKLYEHEFICAHPEQQNITRRLWYFYNEHRWEPNAIPDIREKIYTDVITFYKNAICKFKSENKNNKKKDDEKY